MTTGTITSIITDGVLINIGVTVAGAEYVLSTSPALFDSLDTAGKIAYLENFVAGYRNSYRLPENAHQELIGTVITLPTLAE